MKTVPWSPAQAGEISGIATYSLLVGPITTENLSVDFGRRLRFPEKSTKQLAKMFLNSVREAAAEHDVGGLLKAYYPFFAHLKECILIKGSENFGWLKY